jgi:L-fucose mutarotase
VYPIDDLPLKSEAASREKEYESGTSGQDKKTKETSQVLKGALIHPEIARALAGAGHGAQVLIADGNYPISTGAVSTASRVYLNLAPGLVTAVDALQVVAQAIPIEAATVMHPVEGPEPPIFAEFRALLPGLSLQSLDRFAFYAAALQSDTCLVIATGEQRVYANILLTIGVIPPPAL